MCTKIILASRQKSMLKYWMTKSSPMLKVTPAMSRTTVSHLVPKPIILHKTTSTTVMPVGATILQTLRSMCMTTGVGVVLASVGAGAGTTHGYGMAGVGVGTILGSGMAGAGETAGAGEALVGVGAEPAGAGEASVGAGINPSMDAASATDVVMPLTVPAEDMPAPYQELLLVGEPVQT